MLNLDASVDQPRPTEQQVVRPLEQLTQKPVPSMVRRLEQLGLLNLPFHPFHDAVGSIIHTPDANRIPVIDSPKKNTP